ncbi:MAG: hypothetical protein ACXWNL_16155 [Vulcanimicrobiaceae bacterium]
MRNAPTNSDDIIDSRDIISRLEELEALRKPWAAGWNMPGYMPDNPPAIFETWEEARDYIVAELESVKDNAEENAADADSIADLDSTIARLNAADDGNDYGETLGDSHYFITSVDGADAFEDSSDWDEYQALKAFAEEAENACSDWTHGGTLIRDSYFERYAEQFADDIGAINADAGWPNNCIDWERAARELQTDYSSAEFDGVTYWFR